jgi:NitT/TauT family transport system ATP-binding protein
VKVEAIELTKTFSFGKRVLPVFRNINLTIEHRRFVCLLGPSGCGKSTLLRCIAGLEKPNSGTILVDGRPIVGPGPDRSMVFQDYALFPWCTVSQNIEFGLKLRHNRNSARRVPRDVSRELLELVGLTGFEQAFPHQISGGMRQRVGLARALAVDPGVLLLDEPFAAIDAITREGLQRQTEEIWARTHKTIVFVTHSVDEAALLGDEVHVFGPRPGSIQETVRIDLSRPRAKSAPEFVEITEHLRESITHAMLSQNAAA